MAKGNRFEKEDRIRTGWGEGYTDWEATPNEENFNYQKWNDFMLSLYAELLERYGEDIDGIYTDGMGPGRYSDHQHLAHH